MTHIDKYTGLEKIPFSFLDCVEWHSFCFSKLVRRSTFKATCGSENRLHCPFSRQIYPISSICSFLLNLLVRIQSGQHIFNISLVSKYFCRAVSRRIIAKFSWITFGHSATSADFDTRFRRRVSKIRLTRAGSGETRCRYLGVSTEAALTRHEVQHWNIRSIRPRPWMSSAPIHTSQPNHHHTPTHPPRHLPCHHQSPLCWHW